MSEFKGTKGKWEVYNGTSLLGVRIGNKLFGIDNTNEEAQANALLISKAPVMLEMLVRCEYWISACNENANILKDITKIIKEATEL